jgi:hypothetical protein
VTLLAYHGRMLFKDNPKLREAYEGDLRVQEDRMHKHGRVVTVARLLGRQDGNEVVVLQLNDVVLLWIGDRKLRFRGFEYVGDTEYAQVWEAEVL